MTRGTAALPGITVSTMHPWMGFSAAMQYIKSVASNPLMEANMGNTLVFQAASVGNCRQKEEGSCFRY